MSYPPGYGGGGSIGFEGVNSNPGFPTDASGDPSGGPGYPSAGPGYPTAGPGYPSAGPGYPNAAPAPYPTGGPAIPGPPAANPYGPPTTGMPPYNGGPGYGPPNPGLSFQGVAMAASAFRQPGIQNYGPPGQMYTQPSAYAPAAYDQPRYQPPPTQSAPPQPSYQPPPVARPTHQPSALQSPYVQQVKANQSQLHRQTTLPSRLMPCQGTVKDHSPFHPQQDAEVLRKAMKGFGCDEKAVTHVLCTRSNKQRQQILLEYKTAHGRDLIKDLKSELGGHFEEVIVGLMRTPAEYDAIWLRKSMKGLGTDEATLIEILCTRTNAELLEINNAFTRLFERNLEKDVHSETSGHFRRLLIAQVQGGRDESANVDPVKAQQDAQELYRAGEGRWGTDESRFNVILSSRSFPQLRATFEEYKKVCKHPIETSIEREMSGDLKEGMLTIVKCVKNTPAFFAELLYKAMKGLGTDDDRLIRVCISRSEVDMVQIKQEFANMYGKTLGRFISDDTSGNYKRALLDLIGGLK